MKFKIIIEVLFLIIVIYLLLNGYFSVERLIRALIIMALMILYKYISTKLCQPQGEENKDYEKLADEQRWKKKKKLENVISLFISRFDSYPIIYDIIFILYKLIPWNWPNMFIIWWWEKWYDVRVIISSNMDIYYRKKGKKKKTSLYLSKLNKYKWIVEWVLIYPLYRLLLLPDKLRWKIIYYNSIKDLVRIRIFVYIYSVLYAYVGYYEYIWGINGVKIMLIIYIFVSIIWPSWIWIQEKYLLQTRDKIYYKPTIKNFVYNHSITKDIFIKYMRQMRANKNGYLQIKYNYTASGYRMTLLEKLEYSGEKRNSDLLWGYEKAYGISLEVRQSIVLRMKEWLGGINEPMSYYSIGIRELGKDYMEKKYGESIRRYKELYRCYVYLLLDTSRLMGVKLEGEMKYYLHKESIKGEIVWEKIVPKKYVFSMELYNKLIIYEWYVLESFSYSVRELKKYVNPWDKETKEYLLLDIGRSRGYKLINPSELLVFDKDVEIDNFVKEYEKLLEEIEVETISYALKAENVNVNIKKRDIKKEEMFLGWNVEMVQGYKNELRRIDNFYSLISEKYILDYKNKCMKKK